MEAASTSKMLVNVYQIPQCNDWNDNLKSLLDIIQITVPVHFPPPQLFLIEHTSTSLAQLFCPSLQNTVLWPDLKSYIKIKLNISFNKPDWNIF